MLAAPRLVLGQPAILEPPVESGAADSGTGRRFVNGQPILRVWDDHHASPDSSSAKRSFHACRSVGFTLKPYELAWRTIRSANSGLPSRRAALYIWYSNSSCSSAVIMSFISDHFSHWS